MFFAGMISAHMITKANAVGGIPPIGSMLPIEETLVNTSILLVSGVALFMAHRALRIDHPMFDAGLGVSGARHYLCRSTGARVGRTYRCWSHND